MCFVYAGVIVHYLDVGVVVNVEVGAGDVEIGVGVGGVEVVVNRDVWTDIDAIGNDVVDVIDDLDICRC